jgi:hypothetical protein
MKWSADMPRQSPRHSAARRLALAGLTVLLSLTTWGVGTSGAADNCGTHSFSFVGTRLLNDGISDGAGPFAIDLPAGRYDVVMRSADYHSDQDSQVGQEAERWWFSLDSGFQSVATTDLPDASDTNVTTMSEQDIAASTAIAVHHLGEGGVNSINPVCVGFTLSSPEDEDPNQPGDPDDPGGPGDPDRAIPDPGDPNDPGDPDPDRAIPDPGDPDDPGTVPDEPVEPRLAITGAGTTMIRLVGLAIVLFQIGFLLTLAERRRA